MQNKYSSSVVVEKRHTLLLLMTMVLVVLVCFQSFFQITFVIILPLVGLCLLPVLFSFNTFSGKEKSFILVSVLFLIITLFYNVIGYSTLNYNELSHRFTWLLMGIVSLHTINTLDRKELNRIYVGYTLAIIVLMWFFVVAGRDYILMGEQSEASSIASTWQSSLMMLITGISLIFFIHIKSVFPRVFAMAIIIVTLYLTIFVFQRGTNVIFSFVEIIMILLFNIKNKAWVWLLSLITISLAMVLFLSDSLYMFFEWLANVSPSARLADRFESISVAMQYEDIEAGGGSLNARNRLIGVSWNTFTSSFNHFIFGAGEHRSDNLIIGNHSFIVDALGSFGIIGGALLFVYYKRQLQFILREINKKENRGLYSQCIVVYAFYILRSIYGNVSFGDVSMLMMLYFPLTIRIIQNYKSNNLITT